MFRHGVITHFLHPNPSSFVPGTGPAWRERRPTRKKQARQPCAVENDLNSDEEGEVPEKGRGDAMWSNRAQT